MTDNKQIGIKAMAAMAEVLKENVATFTEVENKRELDINKIEAMLGKTKADFNKVADQLYNDLLAAIPEKEMIEDKKKLPRK